MQESIQESIEKLQTFALQVQNVEKRTKLVKELGKLPKLDELIKIARVRIEAAFEASEEPGCCMDIDSKLFDSESAILALREIASIFEIAADSIDDFNTTENKSQLIHKALKNLQTVEIDQEKLEKMQAAINMINL